jgi:uncharacterized protein (DUF2147 family)
MDCSAIKSSVTACILGTLIIASTAAAQSSPVGLWKTIDDATGKPAALIRITDEHGELKGRIEKLFAPPADDSNPKCTQCTDTRKDQPIIGMTIIEGMRADTSSNADRKTYVGGNILDPDNGKIYKSRLSMSDDGKTLQVRGYIGVPLLGRTQTWLRAP